MKNKKLVEARLRRERIRKLNSRVDIISWARPFRLMLRLIKFKFLLTMAKIGLRIRPVLLGNDGEYWIDWMTIEEHYDEAFARVYILEEVVRMSKHAEHPLNKYHDTAQRLLDSLNRDIARLDYD